MNIINIISKLPRKGTQDSAHSIGSITHIIVHHDAQWRPDAYDDLTRYRAQANFHIGRGEDGLQYHYKISNMGDVYQCRALTDTLWHCGNYPINRASIAICLDGNFEEQTPTAQQLTALQALLDNLCTQHPEFPADHNKVFGHREVGSSACPGRNLIGYVQKYRASGNLGIVVVAPNPPVVQDPPKPTYYKVYDFNGTQVGAYSSEDNARKKLDTIEAGSIKNPAGITIVTKEKKPPVVIPPFKDDTEPKTPTEPPVDEKPQPEVPTAPTDENKEEGGDSMSPKYKLNKNDVISVLKGIAIMLGGTGLVAVGEAIRLFDFSAIGQYSSLAISLSAVVAAALINLGRKYLTGK